MKLKQKKAPIVRKALSAKVAKRSNATKSPTKFSLIKARVVAVRPARKPALPGKGAVLVALKKKERAAEVAKLTLKKAPADVKALNVKAPQSAETPAGNIVPLPENPDPENEEPTAEVLSQEKEVKPVTMEEIRQAYDGDTAYQLYLKEIGQTALLTIEEENYLAARIKKGDKAARERMIKANLRLVVKIARDYEGYGVPLLDLISEGNIGLMKGVERFDPTKGAKLSTYSAWWIKQAIKRALANQGKTIRLPVHVVDKLFHIRRAEARLQEAFGREATDDEIAGELDTTSEKIRELRTASQRPASLEAPLGYDSDNRVADVVADENADDPYAELEGKANTAMLREVMKDLDPREVTILRYRFGLDGDDEKTLEEVGRKFGLTRERIRQIQEIALKKLRKKIEKLEQQRQAA
ncbi:MAG: sigma-70 family RNA polymerase sigma factor [Limisphaerales bacterium]